VARCTKFGRSMSVLTSSESVMAQRPLKTGVRFSKNACRAS
jgi:hypothetical protein